MTKQEIKDATEYLVTDLTADLERNLELRKERWNKGTIIDRFKMKDELKVMIIDYTLYASQGYTNGKLPVEEVIKIKEYFWAKIDNIDIFDKL